LGALHSGTLTSFWGIPKNLYADKIPGHHAEYKREVIDRQVQLMQERGVWKAPTKPQ
jgi:hypothetical protein